MLEPPHSGCSDSDSTSGGARTRASQFAPAHPRPHTHRPRWSQWPRLPPQPPGHSGGGGGGAGGGLGGGGDGGGRANSSQRAPAYPGSQAQAPPTHDPWKEHDESVREQTSCSQAAPQCVASQTHAPATQSPCPEHPLSQSGTSQAVPPHPAAHAQREAAPTHRPCPVHPPGYVAPPGPWRPGHVVSAQSAPVHPGLQ